MSSTDRRTHETGATCPVCGDLAAWDAEMCGACATPILPFSAKCAYAYRLVRNNKKRLAREKTQ